MTDAPETTEAPDGRRLRWREHNEARRRAIIDAAIAVLERQEPGEEVQVQSVADEAGMSRTVIYRHFEDRSDLDREVQWEICVRLRDELIGEITLDRTPRQVVEGIVRRFVSWASAHPTLYWFAERDISGWGPTAFAQAVEALAGEISSLMEAVVEYVGADLHPDDRAGLDPWVFGLIGFVSGGIRRWLIRDVREPAMGPFTKVVSQTVWLQIDGMAQSRGITLPDEPIGGLLATLVGEGAPAG